MGTNITEQELLLLASIKNAYWHFPDREYTYCDQMKLIITKTENAIQSVYTFIDDASEFVDALEAEKYVYNFLFYRQAAAVPR